MITAESKSDIKGYTHYRHVVYTEKQGRRQPGIYERQVTIEGKLAFVHGLQGLVADILPATHIFLKKEQAEEFFTSGGMLRWCVDAGREVPCVFQARIRAYVRKNYGSYSVKRIITPVGENCGLVLTGREIHEFSTEKEALRCMGRILRKASSAVDKQKHNLSRREAALNLAIRALDKKA